MYDLDHLYRQSSRFFHGVESKSLNPDALEKHQERFRTIRSTAKDILATQRANRLGGRVRGPVTDLTPEFSHAPEPHVGPTAPMGSTNLSFSDAHVQVSSPAPTSAPPQVTFSHPAKQQPTAAPTDLPKLPQFSHGEPDTPAPAVTTPAPAVSFSNPEEFNRGVQHVRRPAPGVTFSG